MARETCVGIDTSVCRQNACIVQKAERLLGKQKVDGSIPSVSSNYAVCPGGEEGALKAFDRKRFAGSNPVHGAKYRGLVKRHPVRL